MKFKSLSNMAVVFCLLAGSGALRVDQRWESVELTYLSVDTPIDLNTPEYQVCSEAPQDCSLRGAITRSNANPDIQYQISIPRFVIALSLPGSNEDENNTGDLDIYGTIDLFGYGATINGNGFDRVLQIHPGAHVSIEDVTITGGQSPYADIDGGDADPGGGVFNAGYLKLRNSAIINNSTGRGGDGENSSGDGGHGGGLYNAGYMVIEESNISNNTTGSGGCHNNWLQPVSPAGYGGGIYNQGYLKLVKTSVSDNRVPETTCTMFYHGGYDQGGNGGGIYNAGSLYIIEGVVSRNESAPSGGDGGGIYNTGLLEQQGTDISENVAGNQSGNGGGLYLAYDSVSLISASKIRGNRTGDGATFGNRYGYYSQPGGAGGGIYSAGKLSLNYTSIEANITGIGGIGNTGGNGAGIYNGGQLLINGGNISSNIAGNGGVGLEDDTGNVFGGGSGGHGGGIFNTGDLIISYSRLDSNAAGNGGGGNPGGSGGLGGGLSNQGILELSFSELSGNSSGRGGDGVAGVEVGGAGGDGGNGGGLFNSGSLTIRGVSILANNTGLGGQGGTGPILGENGADGSGGGQYLAESPEQVRLDNVLLADNQVAAGGLGSGALITNTVLLLNHTTLARNSGGDGSGLHAINSQILLTNTLLVSQTVGITATSGSVINLDTTMWGEGSWANHLDWGGAGSINSQNDLYGDPAFRAPYSGDYHLGPDSAAIDQGKVTSLETDMDDQPRPNPNTGIPDIGADEYWETIPISSVQIIIPDEVVAYTPVTLTVEISPTDATPNIHYFWYPQPEAGQYTDTATYNFRNNSPDGGNVYYISLTASNVGGTASTGQYIFPEWVELKAFLPFINQLKESPAEYR